MSGKQIDWEFLKELECPVCGEYMASPISMCENGHNICGGCKERLPECPTCRGKFLNVRNISLEKFATNSIYPCMNREAGCEETFTLEDRDSHLSECLFQNRECPFRKLSGVDCSWTGILSDISPHLVVEHESETAEMAGHFKVELLDFAVGRRYRQVVLTFGELFYLVWETQGAMFSFGVFHFGPKNETKFFKYGLKIGNFVEYVTVTRKCHSYLEGGLKDLQPGKCATLHYGTTQEYLGENRKLSCEILIGNLLSEGFLEEKLQIHLPVCYPTCSSEPDSGSRANAERLQLQQQQQEEQRLRMLLHAQLELQRLQLAMQQQSQCSLQ